MYPLSGEDCDINSTCPNTEVDLKQMHQPKDILSDEYLSGFINIPIAWDGTLIVYLLIVLFKVHVTLHGVNYHDLFQPLRYIYEKIYSVFRWLFQDFSEGILEDWIDDHSLFCGANNLKTPIVMSLITFVVAIVPFGEIIIDVHFLAVLAWHLLYLYRNNLFRLIGFTFALWVVWIEHGFIGDGVDCAGIVYMMFILGFCAWQLLPNEVNLDLLLIYIAWTAYIFFQLASSLSEHGLLPRKTLQELLEQSRLVRVFVDSCSFVEKTINYYLLLLALTLKLKIKGFMLAGEPKFQWMPMHLSESLSFDTQIY